MWDVILNFEKVFCFILVFYQLFFLFLQQIILLFRKSDKCYIV